MFKKLFMISLFFLSACSSVKDESLPITSSSQKATDFYKIAVKHWGQGEGLEARNNFYSALRVDPNFVLANLYVNEPDPQQRRKYRQAAVDNKSSASEAERIQVEMWEAGRDGKSSEKLQLAKDLVNKYPNSSEAHLELGIVYTNRFMFDEAIGSFKAATKLNPDQFDAWRELAQHHVVVGNNNMLPKERQSKELVIKYTEEMIRSRPKAPNAYQYRANIERQYSNFEGAKPLYQKMVDVVNETGSSAKSTALLISGHNLLFNGEFDEGIKMYDEAIAIAATPNWSFRLATIYKTVGYLFKGDYYAAQNLLKETYKTVEETSNSEEQVNENRATLFWTMMMIQSHNQQKKEAFDSLKKWEKYRKANLDESNELRVSLYYAANYQTEAWMNTLFGDYTKAKSLLKKLYEIASKSDNPSALDGYNGISGMVYVMEGNPSKALEFFNERISPANYQYYSYFKALALKATQNKKEANEIFEFIANYNFASWEVGLTRELAKKALES
jgi:tetratricopeptide (TPR) repeat protein